MPEYVCPNCRGGFNDPVGDNPRNQRQCPWCGQALDGSHEPKQEKKFIRRVSVVRNESTDESEGVFGRWLG